MKTFNTKHIASFDKLFEMSEQIMTPLKELSDNSFQAFAKIVKNHNKLITGLQHSNMVIFHDAMLSCVPKKLLQPQVKSQLATTISEVFESILKKDSFAKLSTINETLANKFADCTITQASQEALSTYLCENIQTMSNSLSDYSNINLDLQVNALSTGNEIHSLDDEVKDFTLDIQNIDFNNQQKIYAILDKWKEKNPILFLFICYIFFQIIFPMYVNYNFSAFMQSEAKVRTEPSSQAQIIYIIPPNSTIIIINSVPYYYQIKYSYPDKNESFNGWISKRALTNKGTEV